MLRKSLDCTIKVIGCYSFSIDPSLISKLTEQIYLSVSKFVVSVTVVPTCPHAIHTFFGS